MSPSSYDHRILVIVICIAVGVFVVIVLLCALAIWLYRSRSNASTVQNRQNRTPMNHNRDETFAIRDNGEARINSFISRNNGNEFELRAQVTRFSYDMLARATENFSTSSVVGEGASSRVYLGYLEDTNTFIAVKRFQNQEIQRWKNEASIASMLSHRNVVRLLGWCRKKKDHLLVYEYVENGTLHSHLYGDRLLEWRHRYRIAKGIASALLYVHEELSHPVVHRNIKPKTILLDRDFNVKLGGFGFGQPQDVSSSGQIAGTFGYLDPNYICTGIANKEADVYSFGIVALEISSGRKPVDQDSLTNLNDWTWNLYRTGDLINAADPKLGGEFHTEEMNRLLVVGLWCSQPDFRARPSMREVINVLNFDAPLPTLPLELRDPFTLSPGRVSEYTDVSDISPSERTRRLESTEITVSEELPSSSKVSQLQQTFRPSFEISQPKETLPSSSKISQSQQTLPPSQYGLDSS